MTISRDFASSRKWHPGDALGKSDKDLKLKESRKIGWF
jgi:hypothetical protein